jgi:hypothetical protein
VQFPCCRERRICAFVHSTPHPNPLLDFPLDGCLNHITDRVRFVPKGHTQICSHRSKNLCPHIEQPSEYQCHSDNKCAIQQQLQPWSQIANENTIKP